MLPSQDISNFLQQFVGQFALPQITVIITSQGETATFSAGAHATSNRHRYDLASLGKILASLTTLHLVDRKALSLETQVMTYLPELAGRPHCESLQIWHLLSNTSGYGSMLRRPGRRPVHSTSAQLLDLVRAAPQLFLPGTVFNYQVEDYRLLGQILQRLTGQDILALFRELILEPLGVEAVVAGKGDAPRYHFDYSSRTFVPVQTDDGISDSDGTNVLSLTATDLGKLAAALSQSLGQPHRPAIAGAPLLLARRTLIPTALESVRTGYEFCAYRLGCGEYWDGTLGHGGSSVGQCTALRFDTQGRFAIALTMSGSMPTMRDVLLTAILRMCGYPAEMHARPLTPVFESEELIGHYFCGDETVCVEVQRHGTLLTCTSFSQPPAFPPIDFSVSNGKPVLHPDFRHMSAVFFREPASGIPCLMLGNRAFKRWEGAAAF